MRLPFEHESAVLIRRFEIATVKTLLWILPTAGLAFAPLVAHYLRTVLYLQWPDTPFHFVPSLCSKIGIAFLALSIATPVIWWCSLKLTSVHLRYQNLPVAAMLALLLLLLGNALLASSKSRWFFYQWARVRTPNPSVAKYTLQWMTDQFDSATVNPQGSPAIGLVGSSQIGAAIDRQQTANQLGGARVQLDFIPGCLPLQYAMIGPQVIDHNFDIIVCYLSEFDFYRDEGVPAERLEWGARPKFLTHLVQFLPPKSLWTSRSDLGCIGAGSISSFWRFRDPIRRVTFTYWWLAKSLAGDGDIQDVVASQQAAAAFHQTLVDLKPADHALVDAYFASFEQFLSDCQRSRLKVVILEGSCHPDVMERFPVDSRRTTRLRLQSMVASLGFIYVPAETMPPMSSASFLDGTHVNAQARQAITDFLAKLLKKRSSETVGAVQ